MRRSLLALIVLVNLVATPALAVVCEITCVGHLGQEMPHDEHATAAADGHQHEHSHQQALGHHQASDSSDTVSVRPHDCDHAALLPVLPEVVVGAHSVDLAVLPSFPAPFASHTRPAGRLRPTASLHVPVASPPLRI